MSDLIPVTVFRADKPVVVEGRLIAPGVAITPDEKPDRVRITHIASGKSLGYAMCSKHAEQAAAAFVSTGIDWTRDAAEVLADTDTKRLAAAVIADYPFGGCTRRCEIGDGEGWTVRCNTCDWEWEDEYGEGPLDAKDAKEMANDHECEPWTEIRREDMKEWLKPHTVEDDGTLAPPVSS